MSKIVTVIVIYHLHKTIDLIIFGIFRYYLDKRWKHLNMHQYAIFGDNTAVGIRRTDHATLSVCKKLALTSPTSGCRSFGIVCSRTEATEFSLVFEVLL
jgi:hypothetical protein